MSKKKAYILYRVLCRLNEQANQAWREGRDQDARAIGHLIGRLEFVHFEVSGFNEATA